MAYLPWSQLWMQKQLHTSEDLATSPSGFGYVTSTIPGKSLAHWGQIINIQTLNPVHSMNLGVALSCEPGVPWKIWFRWSPMDQRTFVEVQDSNREVAVPKKKKKNLRLDALERVRRTNWLRTHHVLPMVTQLGTKSVFSAVIAPSGMGWWW